jgi:hypothetical protein
MALINPPTIVPTPVIVNNPDPVPDQSPTFPQSADSPPEPILPPAPEENPSVSDPATPQQPTQQTISESILSSSELNFRSHRYPLDLGKIGQEPFIIFDVRDWSNKESESLGVIALYMPPTIRSSYKALYSEIRDLAKYAGAQGSGLGAEFGQNAFNFGPSQRTMSNEDFFSAIGLNIANLMGDNLASSLIEFNAKKILNPQMTQAFNGMAFRSFQFDFQLMARSAEESEAINNIIYAFKYYMHPGAAAGTNASEIFLEYPENFIIRLYTPETKYIFSTDRCVLTDVDVDYAGSGIPTFFDRTGAPVDIRLTLRFVEISWLSKEDIKKGF